MVRAERRVSFDPSSANLEAIVNTDVKSLSKWSTRRIILAGVLWLLGAPVLGIIGLILGGLVAAALSGDQKISFTARLDNWSLAWLFLPPLLLVVAWLWSKRAPGSPSTSGRLTIDHPGNTEAIDDHPESL
jgi:hypothetical protein